MAETTDPYDSPFARFASWFRPRPHALVETRRHKYPHKRSAIARRAATARFRHLLVTSWAGVMPGVGARALLCRRRHSVQRCAKPL
jgi:hypothetical protein